MRTRISKVAGFCILAATVVAASGPRNQKKPREWTAADAELVITRSPWAIPAKLQCGNPLMPCNGAQRTPEPASQPHIQDGHPITPPPLDPSSILDPGPVFIPGLSKCFGSEQICHPPDADEKLKKELDKMGAHPVSGPMTVPPSFQGAAIVLWESAAPVQSAKSILGLARTNNRLAANSYVISVIGYPMRSAVGEDISLKQPLLARTKNVILQSAELILKDKHPLQADDIEIEGTEEVMNVRFFFPADSSITVNDRSVQFRMQVLSGEIVEATFNTRSMVYEGKPAISNSLESAVQR
jgi:hypothetical protein